MNIPADRNDAARNNSKCRPDDDDFCVSKGTKCSHRYDHYVYGSLSAAISKMDADFLGSTALRPMRRSIRKILKRFRKRQIFLAAYSNIDMARFPWVSESIKGDVKNFKIGDVVECAEYGEPEEPCSIKQFYPGGCAAILTSRGPQLCHLRLTRSFSSIVSPDPAEAESAALCSAPSQDAFRIDDLVEVARRAWVGINKPGGVGKIIAISIAEEDGCNVYDVKYTLGGREKRIEERYITHHDFSRDKRDTRGRCRRPGCSSFIRDCGHTQPGDELEILVTKLIAVKEKKRTEDANKGVKDDKTRRNSSRTQEDSLHALEQQAVRQKPVKRGRKTAPKKRVAKNKGSPKAVTSVAQAIQELDDLSSVIPQCFQRTFAAVARPKKVKQHEGDGTAAMHYSSDELSLDWVDDGLDSEPHNRNTASNRWRVVSSGSESSDDSVTFAAGIAALPHVENLKPGHDAPDMSSAEYSACSIGPVQEATAARTTDRVCRIVNDATRTGSNRQAIHAVHADSGGIPSSRVGPVPGKRSSDESICSLSAIHTSEAVSSVYLSGGARKMPTGEAESSVSHVEYMHGDSRRRARIAEPPSPFPFTESVPDPLSSNTHTEPLTNNSSHIVDDNMSTIHSVVDLAGDSTNGPFSSARDELISRSRLRDIDSSQDRDAVAELFGFLTSSHAKFKELANMFPQYTEKCKEIWRKFDGNNLSKAKLRIARKIVLLSEDFENFRLMFERSVNDVFNSAYTRIKKLKCVLTRVQKKEKLQLRLRSESNQAAWGLLEPKVMNQIKKLELHFHHVYGIPVDLARDTTEMSESSAQASSLAGPSDADEAEWEDTTSDVISGKRVRSKGITGDVFGRVHPANRGLLEHPLPPRKRHCQRSGKNGHFTHDTVEAMDLIGDNSETEWTNPAEYALLRRDIFDRDIGADAEEVARMYKAKYASSRPVLDPGEKIEHLPEAVIPITMADSDLELARSSDEVIYKFLQLLLRFKKCHVSEKEKNGDSVRQDSMLLNAIQSAISDRLSAFDDDGEDWSAKLYDLYSSEQLMVLRKQEMGLVAPAVGDSSIIAWKSATKNLLDRLLSDISDENQVESADLSFNRKGPGASDSIFSNTWRILKLLQSLHFSFCSMEQTSIAGSGDTVGVFEYFHEQCVNFEAAAVDRVTALMDNKNSGNQDVLVRLSTIAGHKLLKYMQFKIIVLKLGLANAVVKFAFESLLNRVSENLLQVVTFFVTFHTNLFLKGVIGILDDKTQFSSWNRIRSLDPSSLGQEFILLWWAIVQLRAAGNSKYTTKPRSAWSEVTGCVVGWLRCSYPGMPTGSSRNVEISMFTNGHISADLDFRSLSANLKAPRRRSVDPQITTWLALAVHSAALLLQDARALDGTPPQRIASNWALIKFLYANPVPQRSRQALDSDSTSVSYLRRLTLLCGVWDNPGECFDMIVELAADNLSDKNANSGSQVNPTMPATVDRMKDILRKGISLTSSNRSDEPLSDLFGYVISVCPVDMGKEDAHTFTVKTLPGVFNQYLVNSMVDISVISKKRLVNKICTHNGVLSLLTRNEQAKDFESKLMFICVVSEVVAALGSYAILVEGGVGELISRICSPVPATSVPDNTATASDYYLLCVASVKIYLPILLVDCELSSDHAELSSLTTFWFQHFLQTILNWSTNEYRQTGDIQGSFRLYPVVLSMLKPLAAYMVQCHFLTSNYCTDVTHETPGVRIFYLIFNVLGIVLSREYGTVLDEIFSTTMRICLEISELLLGADQMSATLMNIRNLIVVDFSKRLNAPLLGVFKLLTNYISYTDITLSKESCDSLSTCLDAAKCLSNLVVLGLQGEIYCSDGLNRSLWVGDKNLSKMQLSKVRNSQFGSTVKLIDGNLSRLVGCDDSTVNHWFKIVFWLPILTLREQSECSSAVNIVFIDHIHSLLSSWLACLATLHLVPEVSKNIKFARFNICLRETTEKIQQWRQRNRSQTQELDIGVSKIAMLDTLHCSLNTLNGYVVEGASASGEYFFTSQQDKNGLRAALGVNIFFLRVAQKAYKLYEREKMDGLQSFRSDNGGFVITMERCIRYLYIRSSESSVSRSVELVDLANLLCATTIGSLCYGVLPDALNGLFKEVLGAASKSFQDYIEKVIIRGRNSSRGSMSAFAEHIPKSVEHVLSHLPMYVCGISLTPFATRFSAWKYLLQIAAVVLDGDSYKSSEKVLKSWAKGLASDTETVQIAFTRKLEKALKVYFIEKNATETSSLYRHNDVQKHAFRRYIISSSDQWLEFSMALKTVSTKPLETLSIVRSRLCAYLVVEMAEPSWWEHPNNTSLRKDSINYEIPVLMSVSAIFMAQLIRVVVLGHTITDVSRFRVTVDSRNEVFVYTLCINSCLSLLRLFEIHNCERVTSEHMRSVTRTWAKWFATAAILLNSVYMRGTGDTQSEMYVQKIASGENATVLVRELGSLEHQGQKVVPADLMSEMARNFTSLVQRVDHSSGTGNESSKYDTGMKNAFAQLVMGGRDKGVFPETFLSIYDYCQQISGEIS